ncbi:winged helix DNA-binding domain-containing protein [Microterricola viridarii]|nr:winged helix DNA-binding domain-containing protein [Microterricola viridarii]
MARDSAHREIALLRARAQGLFPADAAAPGPVVGALLALQAQDLAAATWAVGARSPGTTLAGVRAAIDAGEIVRSWPMRGTLHFVPGEDLGWMQRLTTARLLQQARLTHERQGLTEPVYEQARQVAVAALSGGRSLGRDAFQALLEQNGIDTAANRGYHLIWHLAQTGTLCWGPTAGNAQELVLLDEWVPHPRRLEHEEALGEFLLRYIRGHGPATLADFVWWSKLTVAEAKRGLQVARPQLAERRIGDASYWVAAELDGVAPDAAQRRRFASSAWLLPAFDEYFLGYRDREASAAPEHHERIVPGRNGVFQPIAVAGGRVVGTWRRRMLGTAAAGQRLGIDVVPFEAVSAAQAAGLRRAGERYARFRELRLGEFNLGDFNPGELRVGDTAAQ